MQYAKLKKRVVSDLKSRLSARLTYHSLRHTLDVLRVTTELCALERISVRDTRLLKTAALLHDIGFVEDLHTGHEASGCAIARAILPEFGYLPEQIEQICTMIMSTKIPQSPSDHLAEILCDADLDYLGRSDFYPIAQSLFIELKSYGIVQDGTIWDQIQIDFLEKHRYFTVTNQQRREPEKQQRLREIRARLKP